MHACALNWSMMKADLYIDNEMKWLRKFCEKHHADDIVYTCRVNKKKRNLGIS
jgi:hypothetical protein